VTAAYEYSTGICERAWVGGYLMRQGLLFRCALKQSKKLYMSENEWGYWFEGKAATDVIHVPTGDAAGAGWRCAGRRFVQPTAWVRGLLELRHDEKTSTWVRKWNEFIAA